MRLLKRTMAFFLIVFMVFSITSAMATDTYSVGIKKELKNGHGTPTADLPDNSSGIKSNASSNSILSVNWIDPPKKVYASTRNNHVYLNWEEGTAIDLYSIYEKINGSWVYMTVTADTHISFTATDGVHSYGVSCIWKSTITDDFCESSKVTVVDVAVYDGSDTPYSGADIQELYLSGTTDKSYNINVYDDTYLHIVTDSLTWIAGKNAGIITPDIVGGVYHLSLGNDSYINPTKHLSGNTGMILVGTYNYTQTTYEGVSCYTVGTKRAYFTINLTKVSGLAPKSQKEVEPEVQTVPEIQTVPETQVEPEEQPQIEDNASSITLSKTKLTIKDAKPQTITATLSNSTDSIADVQSSKASVAKATVSGNSITITPAKKAGKATITVTTIKGATAKLTVEVKESWSLNEKKLTMKKGEKFKIKLNAIPSSIKIKSCESSKPKVAKVDKKGKITAKKKGKATITVTLSNGKTLKLKVTVK